MERRSVVFFSLFLILCRSEIGIGHGINCTLAPPCKLDDQSIRFFVLGDWGGSKRKPVSKGQKLCADLTRNMGLDKKPQFFVSTGDNFYEYGVRNAEDPRFKTTFDDVYLYGKNEKIPWYVTQGNHDWYGNASAQVAYTWINDRWVSPSYAFAVSYDARPTGPSIDVIFLDTVVLCGNTWRDTDNEADYVPEMDRTGRKLKEYTGPQDPDAASKMWTWAERRMANSTADYLFVVGHYPAFSSTKHNISSCLVPKLQDLMEKYNVTGYFSGHSHSMQHTKTISRLTGKPIHHVVSGAARLTSANFKPVFDDWSPNVWNVTNEFFFPTRRRGWPKTQKRMSALAYVELGSNGGTVEFYRCNGERIYSFEVESRGDHSA